MLPARLPWNDGDALAAQISQIVDIDNSELLGVHHVPNRPSDLVQQDLQCLLLQVRSDVRPSNLVKLILIDLEIYEPNEILPGAFRRFSKWLPLTLNRISAFRLLELESLLMAYPESSRLWHNHVLIPDGQISPMHLADGDFIKVVIGHHEGFQACSDSDASSFSLESEPQTSDVVSTFQTIHHRRPSQPSFADADPLSFTAVCISGSCDQCAGRPRTHSMNEPFSFFAGTSSSSVRAQPGRPPRVESPIWQQEIWDLLCEEGATEMEEEGPVIYVSSFFISHVHTTCNKISRPLRFDAEHESWEASVRFMWEDFVDPNAPIELFLVSPDPPVTIYEGTVATVLVVQHPQPRKAAIVVTALPDSTELRHVRHVALSADPFVTQAQLIDAADAQDFCSSPGCTIWVGPREFPTDVDIQVHDGLGLQLKIPAHRIDASRSSMELVAVQPSSDPAQQAIAAEEEQDDMMLLSLQTDLLHVAFQRTLRLLNTDPVDSQDCRFEVPVTDDNLRHGQPFPVGHHLEDLHETWHQASPVFAASVEEAAVTFASWFVHSNLWPTCDSPRMLTLHPHRHEWDRQIRSLWRDRMQPGQDFEVSIVVPSGEEELSHHQILVHQGISHRQRGILLSTYQHDDHSHLLARRAIVVPSRIEFLDLTGFAGFHTECRSRTLLCVGFFGRESIDEARPLYPRTGTHLELHMVDWDCVPLTVEQSDPDEPFDEIDTMSLMHARNHRLNRAPRICGINLPEQPHESQPFQFQANAPVFVPGIPWDLDTHDEFVQDLFEAWNQIAMAWETEDRSGLILVWFVDHQWPHPHGHAPRSVRLFSDLHDWRRQIGQAWQDCIILGQELEYQLVTPQPYTVDRRIAAHVIIIQRPNEHWVTNIVSMFDERTLQTTVSQLAITTHEHILLDNLAKVLGIFGACFGDTPTLLCHAWYRDLALTAGAPIPGRSGMSINVLVRPRTAQIQLPDPGEADANSLLTIMPVRASPQDSIKHTATTVQMRQNHIDANAVNADGELRTPAIRSCRVPEQPNSGGPAQRSEPTPIPIPTVAAAPVGIPTFVFDMLTELQPAMLRTDGTQQGFVVRVWYIHHTHRRMSRIARYLHLSGPPHMWQPRIVALWSDRLIPFEAIAIHVVKPRPFRTMHDQNLAFDLIVSQGVHEPRLSGLISVYPSPPDPTFPQFAAAVSFRPQVSGAWLIRKLAFQNVCHFHRCLIFHRWNEIPHSEELVHAMSNGDGFDFHIYRNGPGPFEHQPHQQAPNQVPEENTLQPGQNQPPGEEVDFEEPVLLQLSTMLQFETPSQTESLLDIPETGSPVRLIGLGSLRDQVPSYVTVPGIPTQAKVQQELSCFGHHCTVEVASNGTTAIVFLNHGPLRKTKFYLFSLTCDKRSQMTMLPF